MEVALQGYKEVEDTCGLGHSGDTSAGILGDLGTAGILGGWALGERATRTWTVQREPTPSRGWGEQRQAARDRQREREREGERGRERESDHLCALLLSQVMWT